MFNFTPTSEPKVTEGYRVVTSEFESGKKTRYYKGRRGKKYSLTFQVNYERAKELVQFWRDRKGPFEAFLYQDPHTGDLVKVHFADETLDLETQWNEAHVFRVGLIQVVLEELL